jgi:hypothetical protein
MKLVKAHLAFVISFKISFVGTLRLTRTVRVTTAFVLRTV